MECNCITGLSCQHLCYKKALFCSCLLRNETKKATEGSVNARALTVRQVKNFYDGPCVTFYCLQMLQIALWRLPYAKSEYDQEIP